MKNLTMFSGNLTRDVELTQTAKGMSVASLSIAVNDGFGDNQKTYFPRLKAFGDQADQIAKFFQKGRPISVTAKYTEDKWEDKTTGEEKRGVTFIIQSWEFPPFGNKKSEGDDASSTPSAPSPTKSKTSPKKPARPPVDADADDDEDIPF